MTVQQLAEYVRRDEHDRLLVGDTRVALESIVYPFDEGSSPEEILRMYPALTLEQIYGAIAYYLGHRSEVRDYIARLDQKWEQLKAEIDKTPSPAVERVRAAMRERRKAGISP